MVWLATMLPYTPLPPQRLSFKVCIGNSMGLFNPASFTLTEHALCTAHALVVYGSSLAKYLCLCVCVCVCVLVDSQCKAFFDIII